MTKYDELMDAIISGNETKCKLLLNAGGIEFPDDPTYPYMRAAVEAKQPKIVGLLFQSEEATEFLTDCEPMLVAMATSSEALVELMDSPIWMNEIDAAAAEYFVVDWAVTLGEKELVGILFCEPAIGEDAESYIVGLTRAAMTNNPDMARLIIAFWEQDEAVLEEFFPGTGDELAAEDDTCDHECEGCSSCDTEEAEDEDWDEEEEAVAERDWYAVAKVAAAAGALDVLKVMMNAQGFKTSETVIAAIKSAEAANRADVVTYLKTLV